MKWLLVALLLAACAEMAPADEQPLPTPPLPPAATTGPIVVVRKFDKASSREAAAVMAPDATAEQIDAIRAADHRARRALTTLGRHPVPAAHAEAREAVHALEQALDR